MWGRNTNIWRDKSLYFIEIQEGGETVGARGGKADVSQPQLSTWQQLQATWE